MIHRFPSLLSYKSIWLLSIGYVKALLWFWYADLFVIWAKIWFVSVLLVSSAFIFLFYQINEIILLGFILQIVWYSRHNNALDFYSVKITKMILYGFILPFVWKMVTQNLTRCELQEWFGNFSYLILVKGQIYYSWHLFLQKIFLKTNKANNR